MTHRFIAKCIFNISNSINVFSLSIITLSIIILLINCNIKLPLQKKWDFIWNSSFTLLYVVELSKYLFKWMNTFSVLHLHICCTINQSYSKNSRNISCLRWLMVGVSCIQTRLPQTSKNYVTMFLNIGSNEPCNFSLEILISNLM